MPPRTQAELSATIAPMLWLTCVCFLIGALTAFGAAPGWWITRGAVDPLLGTNDYAVVTQGQLKQFTARAVDELNADLPTNGGAGTDLSNLVYGWHQDYLTNGYATNPANPARPYKPADLNAVNLGQLKYIASLLYTQLSAQGYTGLYPSWLQVNTNTDNLAATVGQLKQVFAFDLTNAPPPITNLITYNGNPNQIYLAWTLPTRNNATSVLIQQSTNGGTNWTTDATLTDPTSSNYVDTAVASGSRSTFRVVLANSAGDSSAASPPTDPVLAKPTPRYAIIDLGADFFPTAMNNHGVMVGTNSGASGGLSEVLDFSVSSSPTLLSTNLPSPPPYAGFSVTGIDDAGHIVGNISLGESTTNYPYYTAGAYWSSSSANPLPLGQMVTNAAAGGTAYWPMGSVVLGIAGQGSGAGYVVGYSDQPNWPIVFEPSWNVSGENIGQALEAYNYPLRTPFSDGTALATGAGGTTNWCGYFNDIITGTNYSSGPIINGTVYTNYPTFYPYAINATNIAVGGDGTNAVSMEPDEDHLSTNYLGTGVAKAINNYAYTDTNDDLIQAPQIVGVDGPYTNYTAMLWDYTAYNGTNTTTYVQKDLNLLIGTDGTNPPPFHVNTASGINDDGVIIGTATPTTPDDSFLFRPAPRKRLMATYLPFLDMDPPPPPIKAFQGCPIEVLDADYKPINYVRFGLWDYAFNKDSPFALKNDSDEADNFVGSDSRRFYLKVIDYSANHDSTQKDIVTMHWYTKKPNGDNEDHPSTDTITLTETGPNTGVFISNGLMLVTNDIDNSQSTNTGLSGGSYASKGDPDHRLRLAALDDVMCFDYIPALANSTPFHGSRSLFNLSTDPNSQQDRIKNITVHFVETVSGKEQHNVIPSDIDKMMVDLKSYLAVAGIRPNKVYDPQVDILDVKYDVNGSLTSINLSKLNADGRPYEPEPPPPATHPPAHTEGQCFTIARILREKYKKYNLPVNTIWIIVIVKFDPQDRIGSSITDGLIASYHDEGLIGNVDEMAPIRYCSFVQQNDIYSYHMMSPHEVGHQLSDHVTADGASQNHYTGLNNGQNLMGIPADLGTFITDHKRLWDDTDKHPCPGIHPQIDYMRESPLCH